MTKLNSREFGNCMNLARSIRSSLTLLRTKGFLALFRSVADRLYIRWFEWRLGIHSESVIELKELGIENAHCRPYVPTDYKTFRAVLRDLPIRVGEDVFLDFGSGLGRATILAATRPFRKVIGVEIAPKLNEVARMNIRRALPRLACRDIELVTADATQFTIPDDVTVIYFFNPFAGDVLARVLGNIRESIRRQPRALRLVCKVPAQSAFETEIRQHSWLTNERELVFDANCRYLFLTAKP
jgi:SAM-dependent methyltransferase